MSTEIPTGNLGEGEVLDQSAAEAAMRTTTSWLRALSSEGHEEPMYNYVDVDSMAALAFNLLVALGRPAAPIGSVARRVSDNLTILLNKDIVLSSLH